MSTATKPAPRAIQGAKAAYLFATPVVTARVDGAEQLAAELKTVILEKKAKDKGVKRSNEGGWHSEADMYTWGGPAAQSLAEAAIGLVKRMSVFDDGTPNDYDWTVSMWANVSGPGALNLPHAHCGNLWSAVFYVDLGRAQTGTLGGELYFEDPRFPMMSMRMNSFHMTSPDGKPQKSQVPMIPNEGDLVIFPAWLRHGVSPYRGPAERISVAINLDVFDRSAAAAKARREKT